ncbi:MAG: 1-acyl-sn-glycerol-3-phosphate acyltransferase [Bacteroidota bacterium]
MLYGLTRPLARVTLAVFYQKIYFSNKDRIPKNQPVLLAANHPTAFLEPCLLACWLPDPIHFMVRGSVFKNAFLAKLLRSLHLIPIYRMKDGGYEKIKQNFATLQEAEQVLLNKDPLLILAEGRTAHEKRLRPLQKGTARLAFSTLAQAPEQEVYIVPVGVNYTYAELFRSEVMIDFGEPIRTSDYWVAYKEHPSKGIRQLTQRLRQGLEERVVIIEDPADEDLVEFLLQIYRNTSEQSVFPVLESSDHRLFAEKQMANTIQGMGLEEKGELQCLVNEYQAGLVQARVNDLGVGQHQKTAVWDLLFVILGGIPALVGGVIAYPPAGLAAWYVDRKIKRLEYRASVLAALGMVLYALYFLSFFLLFGWLFGRSYIGWALLVPALCYWSLAVREAAYRVGSVIRFWLLPARKRKALKSLRTKVYREGKLVPQGVDLNL